MGLYPAWGLDGEVVHEFVPKIPELTRFETNTVSDYIINVLIRDGLVMALRFTEEVASPEFLEKVDRNN